ncbi:MAG TPA: Gfo/Idh/MocA family oxidoreductase [Thermoanaerobaculia bacterium]|nr:Gfo/Idh/MocA family oxidoreductase [Thermoanaerobaculia bacterium]
MSAPHPQPLSPPGGERVAKGRVRGPRLGFAGLGWIGRHRMEAVVASGFAEAALICDPVLGTPTSFDDLLDSDVDAIVVATPSALHADQAVAALEKGKGVFCQKPLGRNGAETRRVVDAARANDRLLGVDLSYRHTAALRKVRELVGSGEIGEVFAADLVFHNAYGPDKPWFYDPKLSGGGCVIDLGIHLVDMALWTLGFPRVKRVTSRLFGQPVEHYATARIDLMTGAALQLACSWNLSAGRDCVIGATFYGTRGAAAMRNVNGSFYDFTAEHYEKTRSTLLVEPPDAWGGRAIVAWAEQLMESPRFDPRIEQVVDVAETLDRIYACAS